jgi:phosphate transport system substrate-binding protein
MNKIIKSFIVATGFLSLFAAYNLVFAGQSITVKGSDTVLVLGQRWAEEYMKQHPDLSIQVTGGGSGVGIAALINGTTDIANASRQIKAAEVDKAQKAGYYPEEFAVALDTLAVVVNSQNPIKELTVRQLMGIYTGKYSNWSEVGGENKPIIRYSRESSSGTYQFFKEFILKNQDFAADCQTLQGTSAVTNAVSKDPGGIGYGGAAYFLNQSALHIISVKKDDKSEAVNPVKADGKLDYEAAWSKRYPIWRYLYMYTGFKPRGAIKEYLDWIKSSEGQKIVEEVGYIPLPKK